MLVRAMENVKAAMPGLSLEDRFRRALRGGGMAVLATSVANVAAFLFGSITTIPAIRWCDLAGLHRVPLIYDRGCDVRWHMAWFVVCYGVPGLLAVSHVSTSGCQATHTVSPNVCHQFVFPSDTRGCPLSILLGHELSCMPGVQSNDAEAMGMSQPLWLPAGT
jgi:Patched family